jgi:hypothetical protein
MPTSQALVRTHRKVPGAVAGLLAALLILGTAGPVFAQSQGEYGTEFNGGVMLPAGKYAKYFQPGFILQGGAYTGLSKAVRFGFSIGYIHSDVDGEAYSKDISDLNSGDYTINGSLKGLPLLLTLRMVTPGQGMRFYGLLDAGVYCYWVKLEGTTTGTSSPAPLPFEEQFFAEPGVAVGFGGLLPVGTNVALDLSVRYHIVKDANYAQTYSDNEFAMNTTTFLGFQLGVNYSFPL